MNVMVHRFASFLCVSAIWMATQVAAFPPQSDFEAVFDVCTSEQNRMEYRAEKLVSLGWKDVKDKEQVREAFLGPQMGHWMLHHGSRKTQGQLFQTAKEAVEHLVMRDFDDPRTQRILKGPNRTLRGHQIWVSLLEWNLNSDGRDGFGSRTDHTRCLIVTLFHPDPPDVMTLAKHSKELWGGRYLRLNLAGPTEVTSIRKDRHETLFFWHRIDYYSAPDYLNFPGFAVAPFSYVMTMTTLRDEEARIAFSDRLVDDPRSSK